MSFVFFTVEEVEDAGRQPEPKSWQDILGSDDRSPKKIVTGQAYLIFVGTFLDAGFREQALAFEKVLMDYMDSRLVHIPSLERSRVWRASGGKLQFIHSTH